MRIDIQKLDLELQTVVEFRELFLELTPAYIRYRASFTAEEPIDSDDMLRGNKTVVRDFDWIIRKDAITSIDKTFTTEGRKVWKIVMTVLASSGDIDVYFLRKSECDRVFNILFDYLFPAPCPTSSL